MYRKALLSTLVILTALTVYWVFTATAAVNDRGKYLSVKGGEYGNARHWDTYSTEASDLNLAWARIPVKWKDAVAVTPASKVQVLLPTSTEYANFLAGIKAAQAMGSEVILTVKGVPDQYKEQSLLATAWNGTPAVSWPSYCGRIEEAYIYKMGEFIYTLLGNLASPPNSIHVNYIEIWNEPDYEITYVTAPNLYGCWSRIVTTSTVVPTQDWLTFSTAMVDVGNYYAQVLKTVVPYVKAYDNNIKIVGGAAGQAQVEYLDTVITQAALNQPTKYIDVLSYHQYVWGSNDSCDLSTSLGLQKTAFAHVRNDLNSRGGTAVPILISEGAMRLSPTPSPSFYNCQANFAGGLLSWVQHQETPNNLKGFIWYTNGHNADWFNSDLLYANGTPKPVYFVWRDWGSVSGAPMIVRDHHFPTATTPSGRMSASDQSEQMGVEPPLLDESAPVIDQPPDQSSHAPYPAPDLAEDAIPSSEPSLDQNAPLPTPTPTPVDTPTPGVDPTTEQTTPTPSLTPTP